MAAAEERVRIAFDAMGGDHGPSVLVEGALMAARDNPDLDIILVGKASKIRTHMRELGLPERRPRVVNADTVVGMAENPKRSLRKKDSSLSVAADLVKKNEADALVTMGNTGAALATTVIKWRNLPGVSRPALAQVIPAPNKPVLLLDVGANVDCRPQHLVDFAIMGAIYAEMALGWANPRVGVLSNGEEDEKGNELSKAVFKELKELRNRKKMNFVGNAEGRDLFSGNFDVIVCDGFVGNVVLKFGESLAAMIITQLKGEILKSPLTALAGMFIQPSLRNFKKQVAPDEFGGAPLLGVNGTCIVGHGSAQAKAVASAIRVAGNVVRGKLNEKIVERVAELGVKPEPNPKEAAAGARAKAEAV